MPKPLYLPCALLCAKLTLAACSAPSPPGSQPPTLGRWQAASPTLHARSAHAVAATATDVIVLAGTGDNGRPVLPVERFDGRAWTEETTLPAGGLNAPAAVALGRRIVLIGGFSTTSNVPTDQVWAYDLDTRQWRALAALPSPRGGHAAAVLDARIHVIGGGNSERTLADHSVYDPATDRWSARAPLPRAMGSPAAVVHRGALVSVGGRSGPSDFGEVWRYDAAADAWRALPPLEPRGTAGAVSVCGAIHLFGGESQAKQAVLGEVLRLDESAGRWTALAPMPTPRSFARAVPFGAGAVLVVGGSTSAGSSHASVGSRVVERFEPGCRP